MSEEEEKEEFEILQLHHINGPLGELLTFPCPHCAQEVFVRLQVMEDIDDIEAWWGKSSEEIDEKQKKFQRKMEEEEAEEE